MGYFGNHSPDTSESSKRSDDKSIVSRFARIVAISGDSAVLCSGKPHLSSIIGPRRDQWRSEIIADDKRKEGSERSADPRRIRVRVLEGSRGNFPSLRGDPRS